MDYTSAVAWGDYDNDGYLDQLVGNSGQANRVYRNNRDGTFYSGLVIHDDRKHGFSGLGRL